MSVGGGQEEAIHVHTIVNDRHRVEGFTCIAQKTDKITLFLKKLLNGVRYRGLQLPQTAHHH